MKKRLLTPPALRPPREAPGKRVAPFGNRNAFKHGRFTRERRALYADIRAHVRRGRVLMETIAGSPLLHPPLEGRDRDSGRGSKTRSVLGEGSRDSALAALATPHREIAAQISRLPLKGGANAKIIPALPYGSGLLRGHG